MCNAQEDWDSPETSEKGIVHNWYKVTQCTTSRWSANNPQCHHWVCMLHKYLLLKQYSWPLCTINTGQLAHQWILTASGPANTQTYIPLPSWTLRPLSPWLWHSIGPYLSKVNIHTCQLVCKFCLKAMVSLIFITLLTSHIRAWAAVIFQCRFIDCDLYKLQGSLWYWPCSENFVSSFPPDPDCINIAYCQGRVKHQCFISFANSNSLKVGKKSRHFPAKTSSIWSGKVLHGISGGNMSN